MKVGTLLRAKGSKKLYLFLGEVRQEDYLKFGLERLPPTWKFDFPQDYVLCDIARTEMIIQTMEEILNYFEEIA